MIVDDVWQRQRSASRFENDCCKIAVASAEGLVRPAWWSEIPGTFGLSKKPAQFTLRIRIPGWARGEAFPSDLYRFADRGEGAASLALNGRPLPLAVERGFVTLAQVWKKGDTVELEFPMPVRRIATSTIQCRPRG